MEVFFACHRRYPTVTIIEFGQTIEEAVKAIHAHEEWKNGRYEAKGPWGYKHCVESYWDTGFDREYPVFEIHKMTGK